MSTHRTAALLGLLLCACSVPPGTPPGKGETYAGGAVDPATAPPLGGAPRISPVFDPNTPARHGLTLLPLLDPNKCADTAFGGPNPNTPVQLWTCDGDPNAQSWTWVGGQLRIGTGQCLDVLGDDVSRATQLVVSPCSPTFARPSQLWGYSAGLLQVSDTNRCAAVDAEATQGIGLTLVDCATSDPRQLWGVGNASGQVMQGVSLTSGLNNGKCADIVAGGTVGGTGAEIYTCNGLPWQQFVFEGSLLRVLGKCLQVNGGGGLVELDDCTGAPSQQWRASRGQLEVSGGGQCLTLIGANLTDGTRLDAEACAGRLEQQWAWGL